MAVIWERKTAKCHYEVRTAGNSVRLYKDNVFHSQWNDTRPLSNGVWDLLFLPALLLPDMDINRVLVLGVGGGAVINQFTQLLEPKEIVGVELDAVHLQIAKRYFGVQQRSVELIQADALEWMHNYKGKKFDVIIEDLFTEKGGEPYRVAEATTSWFRALKKHLQPNGVLVVNFEDVAQMRAASVPYQATLNGRPDLRYQFNQPSYGNSVCAFLSEAVTPAAMRRRLDRLLENYPACRAKGQQFRLRRVV